MLLAPSNRTSFYQENPVRNLVRSPVRGPTLLRLQDKINQHIPKSIRNNQKPTKILPKRNCKEKINTPSHRHVTHHLDYIFFKTNSAPTNYNDQQFSILARARRAFYLSAMEATIYV